MPLQYITVGGNKKLLCGQDKDGNKTLMANCCCAYCHGCVPALSTYYTISIRKTLSGLDGDWGMFNANDHYGDAYCVWSEYHPDMPGTLTVQYNAGPPASWYGIFDGIHLWWTKASIDGCDITGSYTITADGLLYLPADSTFMVG